MTIHRTPAQDETSEKESDSSNKTGGGRVIRVSRATVAAARAQVSLSNRLGIPVAPAVAKIAELAPSFGPAARQPDVTER